MEDDRRDLLLLLNALIRQYGHDGELSVDTIHLVQASPHDVIERAMAIDGSCAVYRLRKPSGMNSGDLMAAMMRDGAGS